MRAHFNGGGPQTTVSMYFDTGSVPRYSYMFLAGSIVVFALHLPLLDRAEKQRKEFLTGGTRAALVRAGVGPHPDAEMRHEP